MAFLKYKLAPWTLWGKPSVFDDDKTRDTAERLGLGVSFGEVTPIQAPNPEQRYRFLEGFCQHCGTVRDVDVDFDSGGFFCAECDEELFESELVPSELDWKGRMKGKTRKLIWRIIEDDPLVHLIAWGVLVIAALVVGICIGAMIQFSIDTSIIGGHVK